MSVIAYHSIFSTYGFWLPNDPRGSWSEVVRRWDLLKHGAPSKVNTRKSVASRRHDSKKRERAKNAMKHEPIVFTGKQAQLVGSAFRTYTTKSQIPVFACAILPNHVHMVIGCHHNDVRQTIGRLKQVATIALRKHEDEKNAMQTISPWAQRSWHVYLSKERDVLRAIRYVEENPIRAGLKRQRWMIVQSYHTNSD